MLGCHNKWLCLLPFGLVSEGNISRERERDWYQKVVVASRERVVVASMIQIKIEMINLQIKKRLVG